MRIISGKARGLPLKSPKGRQVRPTSDRVKESIFATLGDLTGDQVLDLFAGSGALGLEALSRGASEAVFVDRNRTALRCLEDNLNRVLNSLDKSPPPATKIVHSDVRNVPRLLVSRAGTFNIIFADPPYRPKQRDMGASELLDHVAFAEWAGNALLVIEYDASVTLPFHPRSLWTCVKDQRFGGTAVAYCRLAPGQ